MGELASQSQKNFQMKTLCCELLNKSIKTLLPTFPIVKNKELNFMEMIFRCNKKAIQENSCILTKEIYTVEASHAAVLG